MSTPEIQPGLFKLPEVPKDITDFLKPNGEKNSSVPTRMTRPEISELKKNKRRRGTRNANWPNDY